MKRLLVVVMLIPLMAGCSEPPVVVEAALERENAGESLVLASMPVRLLPYDRDAIFDSLEIAYRVPEPAIPPAVREQQERAQAAQQVWREAEARWVTLRDSLRTLSSQLAQLQSGGRRGTPDYEAAFSQFGTLEMRERRVNGEMNAAFLIFNELQQASAEAADSVRLLREAWAEEAFTGYEDIVARKLLESGQTERLDTTDASGFATFIVPEGRWWVHARYGLPFEEVYWNVPIEVTSDSLHIRLNRENAELRDIL